MCTATLVGLGLMCAAQLEGGQRGEAYRARLSSVPVNTQSGPTTLGSGVVTALLEGTTLTVTGRFEGLNSPVTSAHVNRAPRAVRGPAVWQLTASAAPNGTLAGRLTLTTAQVADLKSGLYYVQIHTAQNPDGHLRGWLLK